MKAPKDQWIIQIDITNACIHKCSNCTRSCMHQKKPFMMDYGTFCKAVDSIIDHPGMIGIMGGEPTIHPEFERFCEYLRYKLSDELIPDSKDLKFPTDDYFRMWKEHECNNREIVEYESGYRAVIKGAGLFTSLTKQYLRNLEIIEETFRFQNLNDHTAASYHQPVLVSRKDLGIPDDEWLKLREHCWVNQAWSSSITPKGVFFCEIAAALDYMYEGPGGLPIEKDWWKRDISDFKEQFRWCELCGIPLKTFSRDARECITDVSETNYQLMQEHNCIRLDNKYLNVIETVNDKNTKNTDLSNKYVGRYYINNNSRVTSDASIYAEELYGIIFSRGEDADSLTKRAYDNNSKWFKYLAVHKISDGINGLKKIIDDIGWDKYIVCFTPEIAFTSKIDKLKKCVINPGTLHFFDFSDNHALKNEYIVNYTGKKEGICLLFNANARSFKNNICKLGDFPSLVDIKRVWNPNKIIEFSEAMNDAMYNGKKLSNNKFHLQIIKGAWKNSGGRKTIKYVFHEMISLLTVRNKSLRI